MSASASAEVWSLRRADQHPDYTPTAFAPQASVRIYFGCSSLLFVALPVVPTCAAWVHRHGCESDDRDIDKVRRTLEKPRLDRVPAGAVTMSMQALPTACEYGVKDDNPGSELESNG